MKTSNKLIVAAALALTSGIASAATYTINSGTWAQITTSNNNANQSVSTLVYDNGEAVPCVSLSFACSAFTWNNDAGAAQNPAAANGTYSGTIITDGGGNVIGGNLIVTGIIADQVQVGGNSWWLRQWTNLNIDLATGTATNGGIACFRTLFAPANCSPGVTAGMPGAFNTLAGALSPGACYYPGGTNDPNVDPNSLAPACGADVASYAAISFDANTGILQLFKEGRSASAANGTDLLNQFNLSVTEAVIPVPAAVWLFGSALGLMGVARRRSVTVSA